MLLAYIGYTMSHEPMVQHQADIAVIAAEKAAPLWPGSLKALLTVLQFLVFTIAPCQEFIPNGDFEQGECPPSYSGINTGHCDSWHCVAGSPDYFNCDFYGAAFQQIAPASGTGVVGFFALPNNLFCAGELQRESFAATLNAPLEACRAYRITCDLRVSERGTAMAGTDNGSPCVDVGFYFYSGSDPNPCWNSCGCWTVEPQVRIPASSVPYLQYATITLDFVPDAAYTKVAIGPVCKDTLFSAGCITALDNRGPYFHYFNLDNLSMKPAEEFTVQLSDSSICQDGTVTVSGASLVPVQTWNWSIPGAVPETSSGSTAGFRFPVAGTYEVHLQVTGPCGPRDVGVVDTVVVHPTHPAVQLPPSLLTCGSSPFTVPDTWPGLVYQWSDGMMGPTRLFDRSGIYRLTASDANGCHFSEASVAAELLGLVRMAPNATRERWTSAFVPNGPCRAVLFDMLGDQVLVADLSDGLELDASSLGLSSGMYLLRLELGDCLEVHKLMLCR
jgi:hypothetical protein